MTLTHSAPLNIEVKADSAHTADRDIADAQFNLKPGVEVPSPTERIDYVELEAIDFSKYEEGFSTEAQITRKTLARQLDVSLRTKGFFYIINHGISDSTIKRINSITEALNSLEDAEKLRYRSGGMTSDEDVKTTGAERGEGFKPRKYWGMANGVRDNIEFYNLVNLVQDSQVSNPNHPELIRVYLNEISNYFRYIHFSVLRKLTILCDIILELPEETLWERCFKPIQGDLEASGGGFGRLMTYFGQSENDNKLTGNTWLRGHSDSTGFTFIASQPIVALQILDYATNSWEYVKHVPGALIVNIGDGIEFLTGGYFRSTIHRVVNPFPSQQGYTRQSLIYFCKPAPRTVIDPNALNSPLLKRKHITTPPEWEIITYADWDLEKGRLFGKSKINNAPGDAPEPVLVHGRYAERWIPTLLNA